MFKFKLSYVMLAAALSSSFAYADPTSYTHSSGTKVIDIEKPNAAGVSHNMYRDFNVDSKGLILNNSANDLKLDSLGNIAKNNNLTDGSASVILNEVISNKSSALNGFIEVAGNKADVIIANPNGISCSGCSFINTNKAILTTGNVTLDNNGAIANYTVTSGKITIGKNGMDAANSYAVLLADAIAINGTVNAANALIGAGNSTFDPTTGNLTSKGKQANLWQTFVPEYSIDISNLGGIKANSITMIGNNLGFGVRNKGAIVANSSLNMTSYGSLVNEGSIASNGLMTQMVSAGNFKNTGNIATNNTTLLNSLKGINNEGTISSSRQLIVNSTGDIENRGTITGTSGLSMSADGSLKTTYGSNLRSDNALAISLTGDVHNSGSINAKNTTINFGGDFEVSGNLSGTSNLIVQSVKDYSLSSGQITNRGQISGGNVVLQTKGAVVQESTARLNVKETLTMNSNSLSNKGNVLAANLVANNDVTQNYGSMTADTMSIKTYSELLNEGTLSATNDMRLDTQNYGNLINRATIRAGGELTINAKKVINGGYSCGWFNMKTCGVGTLEANKLTLTSSHAYASNMGGNQNFKSTETTTIN